MYSRGRIKSRWRDFFTAGFAFNFPYIWKFHGQELSFGIGMYCVSVATARWSQIQRTGYNKQLSSLSGCMAIHCVYQALGDYAALMCVLCLIVVGSTPHALFHRFWGMHCVI